MVDAERLRMLMAMGVDVYALRSAAAAAVGDGVPLRSEIAPAGVSGDVAVPRLVVVCGQGMRGDARRARLLEQLPQTLGIAAAAIAWLEGDAQDALAMPPPASAYLVFGTAMARSLGVQLSTMQQSSASIAVSADPAQLSGSAAHKRALWQALKPLARRLRGQAG
ncbi:MAG: hypothetical protein ACREPT_11280 [Rudaea sp.]